jgi:hypothetical protein
VYAFTTLLAKKGVPSEQLQLIKTLRDYAGEKQRTLDIFKNKTWIDIARGQIKRGLTVCTLFFFIMSSVSEAHNVVLLMERRE